MSKKDLPMFQQNRYYTHERNGMFYVVRFFRGSNCAFTAGFSSEDARRTWVEANCLGFVPVKAEHNNHST